MATDRPYRRRTYLIESLELVGTLVRMYRPNASDAQQVDRLVFVAFELMYLDSEDVRFCR